MSVLPLVAENSDEGVRQVFEEFREDKNTSFVPNFFKTMANSPTAVRGTWDVYRQVGNRGVVPTALKEMIFVVISAARNCKYCESAHLAFCKVLGVDSETMVDLVHNLDLIRPIRLRDILKFSVACALNPQGVTTEDYDNLRSHGLSSDEIVEIIAMCAFSMYATTFADATKIAIDDEFTAILHPNSERKPSPQSLKTSLELYRKALLLDVVALVAAGNSPEVTWSAVVAKMR